MKGRPSGGPVPGDPAPGDLVLGIDCSTTACKAIAWDAAGNAVADGRWSIPLDNPLPDAWQQDPEKWWVALCAACRQVVGKLGGNRRIAGACIAHQRETFVVTDDEGRALHPALVWMDHRCSEQVARAVAKLGADKIHRLSGKPAHTTPSLYKLMFLLDKEPRLRKRLGRVLDVHGYLAWRLTDRCATSLASADPMGMIAMAKQRWAPRLLALCELDEGHLPELVAPGELIARLSRDGAEATGLAPGLPLYAGAGDGQAAGLGAGIAGPGRAYLNLGTAIVSGVLSHEYKCDRAFRTLYGAARGTYFFETDLHGGTFTINWLVERLMGRDRATRDTLAELEEGAGALRPGADGLVLVPYWAGVMNPYWDGDASGVVLGWRGHHGPEHLFRAVLEGIAFEQRAHTIAVEQATGPIEELVVMGGGSQSALWCQIVADVTGKRVTRSRATEATALGAGVLAAAAAGLHPSLGAAVAAMTSTAEVFEPGPDQPLYDRLYFEVYDGLYATLRERMHRLAELRNPG